MHRSVARTGALWRARPADGRRILHTSKLLTSANAVQAHEVKALDF